MSVLAKNNWDKEVLQKDTLDNVFRKFLHNSAATRANGSLSCTYTWLKLACHSKSSLLTHLCVYICSEYTHQHQTITLYTTHTFSVHVQNWACKWGSFVYLRSWAQDVNRWSELAKSGLQVLIWAFWASQMNLNRFELSTPTRRQAPVSFPSSLTFLPLARRLKSKGC